MHVRYVFLRVYGGKELGNLLLVVVVGGTRLANVELVVVNVLEDLHDESLTLGLEELLLLGLGLGIQGLVGLDVGLGGLDESCFAGSLASGPSIWGLPAVLDRYV